MTFKIKQELPINILTTRIFKECHEDTCRCKNTFYPSLCELNEFFKGSKCLFQYIDLNIYRSLSRLRFTDKKAIFNKANNYIRLLDQSAIEDLTPKSKIGNRKI